jgi:hypothetical protein
VFDRAAAAGAALPIATNLTIPAAVAAAASVPVPYPTYTYAQTALSSRHSIIIIPLRSCLVPRMLLCVVLLQVILNIHFQDRRGDNLVVSTQANKNRAFDLIEEKLAFVPPELPSQGVVDGDFGRAAVVEEIFHDGPWLLVEEVVAHVGEAEEEGDRVE